MTTSTRQSPRKSALASAATKTPRKAAKTIKSAPALPASTKKRFRTASGVSGTYYSLPELAKTYPNIERLPVSIRIVLESVLRNYDGRRITDAHIKQLANWKPKAKRTEEIPFVLARVVLQDFTGVPLLADLAAMRTAAAKLGKSPEKIEPLVPVDLVVDHSIMVDYYGTEKALDLNMKLEFQRNQERYAFMKWGMQAFNTFGVVPPGFGIVHQVNLEYFARGVHQTKDGVYYPDTLVGTDSHTTMINGIGVVGWGVGGIEAEAAMLGQPLYFLTPDVVGFELTGRLREGVTATDLVLTVTEILRQHKVVGKFVEFFGEGTESLAVPDRATIGNMAPEYGATMGFFPVDDKTLEYFEGTGRSQEEIDAFAAYFKAQKLFGIPKSGAIDYSQVVSLDLGRVTPSLAGPKRPQDRIELGNVKSTFIDLFSKPVAENGFNQDAQMLRARYYSSDGVDVQGKPSIGTQEKPATLGASREKAEMVANKPAFEMAAQQSSLPSQPAREGDVTLGNGDVLIAAITSCTNTSNPSVLLAAGLLAKKAVKKGLTVQPHIKTSLAPGSRIVTEYLEKTGLLPYLAKLGFNLAGYGCTTCIGNAGDLRQEFNDTIVKDNLVCAAVLSGNRNFEARIHPNIKANFLASPPLVVAYAIAGTVLKDLMTEPVGTDKKGRPVYLGDIWPSSEEVYQLLKYAMNAKVFRANYSKIRKDPGKLWEKIKGSKGETYSWPESTYIAEPPFFEQFTLEPEASSATSELGPVVQKAHIMALFGDSITTDHISPAGSIKESSPAGIWLKAHGVMKQDFNSYGSRRGNHEVMMRGTFANVRIKNLMIPAAADGSREEGGVTLYQGEGAQQGAKLPIYDAAMQYIAAGKSTVIFAGEEYGTGSSRDWAAKGTQLLGIKAVVARSFERIHRSNLVGMGVLPLQFKGDESWQTLLLDGSEQVDIVVHPELKPQSDAVLTITRKNGQTLQCTVTLRIDTPIEVDYYRAGGILPYVLRQLLA
ncbi:aconitate hydratase [Lampropedia puyangensis]|uniref:Aconitate hydratase A n=1 Tax=Lampropedia puyangensis TaxID=1330072 RepID=A0A4S8F8V3_9BURK|nr:aconitate hydratase [Lampropedia puyangensis]THU04033.1 aconitate hydratase [Lampropedia puyangensis]